MHVHCDCSPPNRHINSKETEKNKQKKTEISKFSFYKNTEVEKKMLILLIIISPIKLLRLLKFLNF